MGGVLNNLPTFNKGSNSRMSFEFGDDVFRTFLLCRQFRKFEHNSDSDGVKVGVNKATTIDSRCATKNFDVDSLVIAYSEALINDVL